MTDSPSPRPESLEAARLALPCIRIAHGWNRCEEWNTPCYRCESVRAVALAIDAAITRARTDLREEIVLKMCSAVTDFLRALP